MPATTSARRAILAGSIHQGARGLAGGAGESVPPIGAITGYSDCCPSACVPPLLPESRSVHPRWTASAHAGPYASLVDEISEVARDRLEIWWIPYDRSQDLGAAFALVKWFASEHLVQHGAEGPNIGAWIDRLTLGLLRSHVGRSAHNHAAARCVRRQRCGASQSSSLFERLRQPEIQEFHAALGGEFHIRGLQIAVDNTLGVSIPQRRHYLTGNSNHLFLPNGSFPDPLGQRRPFHQFHDQRAQTA